MKKLMLILLAVLFILSCDKSDNSSGSWIKLDNVSPKSGSSVAINDALSMTISYNISQEYTEGNGFKLRIETNTDNSSWTSLSSGILEKRSDEFDYDTYFNRHVGYGDYSKIEIRLTISRLSNDQNTVICTSDVIKYTFIK